MTSDEVTKAKERRWVRQMAEAIGEVLLAEVPPDEVDKVTMDFISALSARVDIGFCRECLGTQSSHRMDCSGMEGP